MIFHIYYSFKKTPQKQQNPLRMPKAQKKNNNSYIDKILSFLTPCQSKEDHNTDRPSHSKFNRRKQVLHRRNLGEAYIEENKKQKPDKETDHNELKLRVYLKIDKNSGVLSEVLETGETIYSRSNSNNTYDNKKPKKYDKSVSKIEKREGSKFLSEKRPTKYNYYTTKRKLKDEEREQSKPSHNASPLNGEEPIGQSESVIQTQSQPKKLPSDNEHIYSHHIKVKGLDKHSKISVSSQYRVGSGNQTTIKELDDSKMTTDGNTTFKDQTNYYHKTKDPSLEKITSDKEGEHKEELPGNKMERSLSQGNTTTIEKENIGKQILNEKQEDTPKPVTSPSSELKHQEESKKSNNKSLLCFKLPSRQKLDKKGDAQETYKKI